MARIEGVNLNKKKEWYRDGYGIGVKIAKDILDEAGIAHDTRTGHTDTDIVAIRDVMQTNYNVEETFAKRFLKTSKNA